MPKIAYIDKKFHNSSLILIESINHIIDQYTKQGYTLTLRQLYYQLVARDIIPNNQRSYKNLGNLVNDGRLAGLIDWGAIEDRTRNLLKRSQWLYPRDIILASAQSYHIDYWATQENYIEVWIEKDALIGIVNQICHKLDVPHFSCRGYVSQSEMWSSACRLNRKGLDKNIILLHLGDHDPSGIDMSRDIQVRLALFGIENIEFKRLALNRDQIDLYNPPPNPTKVSDSRAQSYISRHGYSCWELDALEPSVLKELIESNVLMYRDEEKYQSRLRQEQEDIDLLMDVYDHWEEIADNY